jgi:hypothetical protein
LSLALALRKRQVTIATAATPTMIHIVIMFTTPVR